MGSLCCRRRCSCHTRARSSNLRRDCCCTWLDASSYCRGPSWGEDPPFLGSPWGEDPSCCCSRPGGRGDPSYLTLAASASSLASSESGGSNSTCPVGVVGRWEVSAESGPPRPGPTGGYEASCRIFSLSLWRGRPAWARGAFVRHVWGGPWRGECYKVSFGLGYWKKVNQSPTQAKLYKTFPPWNGEMFGSRPDIRVDVSPTRGSIFWESRESIFQVRHGEVKLFVKKAYYGGWGDSNARPKTHVLPSSPYVKVILRWAAGKREANRLPKRSLKIAILRQFVRHFALISIGHLKA